MRKKTEKGIVPGTKFPAYSSVWPCTHDLAPTMTSSSRVLKKYIKLWFDTKVPWFLNLGCLLLFVCLFLQITCFTALGSMSVKMTQQWLYSGVSTILKSFLPILERLYHSTCYWLMDKTNVALTLLLSPETASFCPFLRVWREITVASVFSWSRPKPEISYKIKWQRNISSIELFHRQSEESKRSYCMTQGQRASRSIKQQNC